MIIEAEFEEVDGGNNDASDSSRSELNLAEEDSLPWLEADEAEDQGGGVDTAQLVGFLSLLAAVLLVVVGLIWYVSSRADGPAMIADGSTIEAPDGPYKERPEDAGGKEFPGTGDVAPGVGEGLAPEGQLASSTSANAGAEDLNVAMPPIAGENGAAGSKTVKAETGSGSKAASGSASASGSDAAATQSGATGGVGVQLAAYTSKARAEEGWTELARRSQLLSGLNHRVVQGKIAMGTVYRLQAVTANRAAADQLCRGLKSEGMDCQVKP